MMPACGLDELWRATRDERFAPHRLAAVFTNTPDLANALRCLLGYDPCAADSVVAAAALRDLETLIHPRDEAHLIVVRSDPRSYHRNARYSDRNTRYSDTMQTC